MTDTTLENDPEHYERILAAEGLGPEVRDKLGMPDIMIAAYGAAVLGAGIDDTPEMIADAALT